MAITIQPGQNIEDVKVGKLRDREVYEYNALEAQFGMVLPFNPDRIITASLLPNGAKRKMYDPETNTYYEDGPTIVTDNNGNLITT